MTGDFFPKAQHYFFGLKHVVLAEQLSDLNRILQPDINLVLYPKNYSLESLAVAQKLLATNKEWQFFFSPKDKVDFSQIFAPLRAEEEDAKTFLPEFSQLSQSFLSICKTMGKVEKVRAVLGPVSREDSRAWHTSYMRLRLCLSLAGAGLEWVKNDDVNRAGLADPSTSFRPRAELQTVPLGTSALYKGELFPYSEGRGLVHRIPRQLENQKTLLFRLEIPEEALQ